MGYTLHATSVILMSANIDKQLGMMGFTHGAFNFLNKTVEILELLQKVQIFVSIKSSQERLAQANAHLEKAKGDQFIGRKLKLDRVRGKSEPITIFFLENLPPGKNCETEQNENSTLVTSGIGEVILV